MRRLVLAPCFLVLCAFRPDPGALGLAAGARWEYAVSAHFEDDYADGRREVRDWSGSFTDSVIASRAAGELTIFEIRREVTSADPPPSGTADVLPRRSKRFVVLGGAEVAYEGQRGDDFARARRHRGTAVRIQEGRFVRAAIDRAVLWAVLPLRPGTAWHETSRDRAVVGGRNCTGAIPMIRTAAGTFRDCHEIATPWTAADEVEIVCRDVGMIEHRVRDEAGSARFQVSTRLLSYRR